jgi:hypothetical protein
MTMPAAPVAAQYRYSDSRLIGGATSWPEHERQQEIAEDARTPDHEHEDRDHAGSVNMRL